MDQPRFSRFLAYFAIWVPYKKRLFIVPPIVPVFLCNNIFVTYYNKDR